jgi:glycine dehydrogenase subunit 2
VGVDVIHINLHKTFTTPHGGGGPGSGPVCFKKHLEPFQPRPVVVARETDEGVRTRWMHDRPLSRSARCARFRATSACSSARTRTSARWAARASSKASELAVLNARYLWARLKDHYLAPVEKPCMHEVMLSDVELEKATGVKTLDIGKRLLDYGFHAPTVYFPSSCRARS